MALRLESIVAVDHLDLVCNGRVMQSFVKRRPLDHANISGSFPLEKSGWCLLRASTDGVRYPVLDNYVYATTSPIYITVDGRAPRSAPDASYFQAWIERVTETTDAYPDWTDAAEKRGVLDRLRRARAVFAALEGGA